MKKLKFVRSSNLLRLVMLAMVLLASACSEQIPAATNPIESTPLPPSVTPIPPTLTPVLPTLAPTATIVPGPAGYLLTLADLPSGFEWTNSAEIQFYPTDYEISATYSVRFYSDGWLSVLLTVSKKPYEKIPDGAQSGTPVALAQAGQGSQAYVTGENPGRAGFRFIKGNVLVELNGPVSTDTALKLAQIIAARLPDLVSDPPAITFPETLDPAAYTEHFSSIGIGTCDSQYQKFTPATVFAAQDIHSFCIDLKAKDDPATIHKYSYAVYDVQSQM